MMRPGDEIGAGRNQHRRLGLLAGCTRCVDANTKKEQFTLDILDLDSGQTAPVRIPLKFFGHGLAVHPKKPWEAAVVEKRGTGGCVLDLRQRCVIQPIVPMDGHAFYGHGAYSREGDELFLVETQLRSNKGSITIRDSSTLAVLGVLPTYGMAPHDCHLEADGRTLVITNGGGPFDSPPLPSVTIVDVRSSALLEKHEVLDHKRNVGHVAVTINREFAAVSAPRDGLPTATSLGGVTLRRQGQSWVHMLAPSVVTSRLVGESLSVAIHGPSRTVAATHPDGGLITFWSFDRCELIERLELPEPRGVTLTLDERFYAVSYGNDARLLLIQASSFQALPTRAYASGMFGGAHLYSLRS
jgi:uncharacterized protein